MGFQPQKFDSNISNYQDTSISAYVDDFIAIFLSKTKTQPLFTTHANILQVEDSGDKVKFVSINIEQDPMEVWILTSRSIPKGIEQMKVIQTGDYRKAVASWRKSFNRNWNQCQGASPQSLSMYHTNATRWTCECEAFLVSSFPVCKHKIRCFEKPQVPIKFFGRIGRQRSCPFWVEENLILRPEFGALGSSHTIFFEESVGKTGKLSSILEGKFKESNMNSNSDSDSDSFGDSEGQGEESLEGLEDEAPTTYEYPEFQSMIRRAMEIRDEQEARGNTIRSRWS